MSWFLRVDGNPAPQGSKVSNGKGRGFREASKYLPAWRELIRLAAEAEAAHLDDGPLDFPLHARLDVYLPAPKKSKFGKYPAGPPDLDKLQRAVGDGLKAGGLIMDDARLVKWTAEKFWADEDHAPGVEVRLTDRRTEPVRIESVAMYPGGVVVQGVHPGWFPPPDMGGMSITAPLTKPLLTEEAYAQMAMERQLEREARS